MRPPTNPEGQTTPITQKCPSFSSGQHKGVTGIQYHLSHVYRVFANNMSSVRAFRQEGPNPDWFGRNESKLPSENKSVKGTRTTAAACLGFRFVETDSLFMSWSKPRLVVGAVFLTHFLPITTGFTGRHRLASPLK